MSSTEIQQLVQAQRRAKHCREVERMAAASPVIRREREVERILNATFGPAKS